MLMVQFLFFIFSYNALERREASKGVKDASKKSTTSHSSAKGSTAAASRAQVSQNARRNEASVNSGNQVANASKPPSNGVSAYDEQVSSEAASTLIIWKKRNWRVHIYLLM